MRTQIFVRPKFVCTQIMFFGHKIYWTQNIFRPNFLKPKSFLGPNFLFGPNNLLDLIFCCTQTFVGPSICSGSKYLWTHNLLQPKFCWTQKYSGLNIFCTQHLFRPNILLDLQCFLRMKGKIVCLCSAQLVILFLQLTTVPYIFNQKE